MDVTGSLIDTGSAIILAHGLLEAAGSLAVSGLTLAGGTLGDTSIGTVLVGTGTGTAGTVTVTSGAAMSGFGTISAVVNDAGSITTTGKLTLADTVSGTGTVTVGAGATITAQGALGAAQVDFAAGSNQQLLLTNPGAFTSTVAGFGTGDKIGLGSQAATKLSFAGGVLTVYNGATVTDTLQFSGNYTTADFKLEGATGDKSIGFAGTPATALPHFAPPQDSGAGWSSHGFMVAGDAGSFAHFAGGEGFFADMSWAAAHFSVG